VLEWVLVWVELADVLCSPLSLDLGTDRTTALLRGTSIHQDNIRHLRKSLRCLGNALDLQLCTSVLAMEWVQEWVLVWVVEWVPGWALVWAMVWVLELAPAVCKATWHQPLDVAYMLPRPCRSGCAAWYPNR